MYKIKEKLKAFEGKVSLLNKKLLKSLAKEMKRFHSDPEFILAFKLHYNDKIV